MSQAIESPVITLRHADTPIITLREVLSIIIKSRISFLVVFLIFAVPLALLPYTMKHQYESEASIMINSGPEFQAKLDSGSEANTPPYLTKQEIINSELAILASRSLAVATIDKVGLAKLYPSIAKHPPSGMSAIDAAVLKFSKDFKATPITMSEVIYLSYFNHDRDVAIQTISTLIDIYQQEHASIFGDTTAPFLASQLQSYETQLAASSAQIAQLRTQKSLYDVSAQTSQLIEDRSEVVDELNALQAKAADANGRIAYYTERLKTLSPLVEAGQTQSDAVDAAKTQLLGLQVELQKLRQRYTEDVKPIQDVEAQIDTVKGFIAGKSIGTSNVWMQRNPDYDDATMKLQQSEADATSLGPQITLEQQDLATIDHQLTNLVDGGKDLESLELQHKMLSDLALSARTRYEDAKASQYLDQGNVGSVNIISSPSAATKYAKPKHKLFILVGIALGLIADAGLLLYYAVFKETLITAESAERLLNVKVLGAIPYDIART